MAARMDDPVFQLSSDLVDAYSKLSPVMASMAGVPGVFDGWDDYSPEGGERLRAFFAEERQRLDALPPASDRWARLARRVTADFLDDKLAYYEHGDDLRDLNNIESPFQHLRMVFDVMDTSTLEGWEALVRRLETLDVPLAGYQKALEAGAKKGLVAAKRQVRAVRQQARAAAASDSSFLEVVRSVEASPLTTPAQRTRAAKAFEGVRAACAGFADFLERYEAQAVEADAFGPERYARASKRFLGMTIDPFETYAWGWAEVARIEEQMRVICEGIAPGKSVKEVVEALQNDPAQRVEDHQEFLKLVREREERALRELMGSHFDVPEPIRTIEIKLAPAGGALGAYYIPPSDGFTRPGTVFYAPGEGHAFTIFSEITTAYHEGFPGHHLQCGLQVYLADRLSKLHRCSSSTAATPRAGRSTPRSSWTSSAISTNPSTCSACCSRSSSAPCVSWPTSACTSASRCPRARATHPGKPWSWELCVAMLEDRAFLTRAFAESEATRYLGWPGQATSYKIGERVILDLRSELRAALGEKFDLRAFHDAVLTSGSVGLEHLQSIVREALLPG
jgi:uncharacterized protein (DUF885 family)